MSTTVDDDCLVVPPDDGGELSDAEILARCREIEAQRRSMLAEHIRLFRELEARKLYYDDGHRDLAGFARAEYRRADRDATAHRDLERFARTCPQVLEQLTIGRVGSAQAFLLARLSRAPRVGIYVTEQIDDFLDHATRLSYLDFEQYVTAWKYLIDQDGPDPDRAHRNRKAPLAETAVHGLEQVLGIDLTTPARSPFGPDRAFCNTFDGNPIAIRDAVLAGIAGKIRIVIRDTNGIPTAMSSASRLFTGAIRDAVLMTATHCTHDGCIVPASLCQIDHLHPHSHGGQTCVDNAGPACGHHNRWRYTTKANVKRLPDGTIATYRADGTRIAPPPT